MSSAPTLHPQTRTRQDRDTPRRRQQHRATRPQQQTQTCWSAPTKCHRCRAHCHEQLRLHEVNNGQNYSTPKGSIELMTRHKSTVAEFFSKNYDWFFAEFNSRLILSASNYFIRRQAILLLRDILLEKSNTAVMVRYVSSKEHLIILMNLLRDHSKAIQVEAFHIFKLFVASKDKPPEIVSILQANRNKLLRFLKDFDSVDKEDKRFEADKGKVMSEILGLLEIGRWNWKRRLANYYY
ncbi:hypothetical protein U9M48_006282 [Paspalum notatum var. saurae]|uniref:MO25-like protein n=1 Tax=Paspalum notatum var. saurae TaxID=547442 RepID=A0AAQ3PP46_PASNO